MRKHLTTGDDKNIHISDAIDSGKIKIMIERCCQGIPIANQFFKLNPAEKKDFVQKILTKGLLNGPRNNIALLLMRGDDSLELLDLAIQVLEDEKVELYSQETYGILTALLFKPINSQMTCQKDILISFLNYFEKKGQSYDPESKYAKAVLEAAIQFGTDDAAVYLLNKHKESLNPESLNLETCQKLLNMSCSEIIKPKCVLALVQLGAVLPFDYANIFLTSRFNESNPISKQDFLCFLDLLKSNNGSVPLVKNYFHSNDAGYYEPHLMKEKHDDTKIVPGKIYFKKLNKDVLGYAVYCAADKEVKRDSISTREILGLSALLAATEFGETEVLECWKFLDEILNITSERGHTINGINQRKWLIESTFKNSTDSVLQEFEQMITELVFPLSSQAFTYGTKDIILDNIKTMLDVNPGYQFFCPKKLHHLAVYSIFKNHPLIHSLLERGVKLEQTLNSWQPEDKSKRTSLYQFVNNEGNTLADLAAFYSTDEKLLKKLRNIRSINPFGRTPSHYAVLALLDLDLKEHDRSFSPRYSEHAFENSNLISHAQVCDKMGFTPIDYAMMLQNKNRRNDVVKCFRRIFIQILDSMEIMHCVNVRLIYEYLAPSEKDQNNLIIRWVKTLIANENLLTPQIKSEVTDPLKSIPMSKTRIVNTLRFFNAALFTGARNRPVWEDVGKALTVSHT